MVLRALKVRNNQHFQVVSSQSFAKRGSTEQGLTVRLQADGVEEAVAVRIGIRVAHRNVYLVAVVF